MRVLATLFSIVLLMISCASVATFEVGQIITPQGEILVWLHEETPKHKKSFIELANEGYWDRLTFNRVIPDFVAQAGCPDTPEGFNDPAYLLEPEFNEQLTHVYGAFGAGRDGNPEKNRLAVNFISCKTKKGSIVWMGTTPSMVR